MSPNREQRRRLRKLDRSGGDRERHPSIERLAAYLDESLAPAAAERVQAHLVICRGCLDRLLELADFRRGDDPAPPLDEVAIERAWRGLGARDSAAAESEPAPARRPRVPLAAGIAAAAAALALLVWNVSLQRQVARLTDRVIEATAATAGSRVNVPVLYLEPRPSSRQSMPRLSVTEEMATVVLRSPDAGAFDDYRLEMLCQRGDMVLEATGLRRTASGGFTLTLAPGRFEPGVYRLRLYGMGGRQPVLVDEYGLRLASAP